MSGLRKMRRSMAKANGTPLRRGPAKGSTGAVKGPARLPSLAESFKATNRAKREAAKKATPTPETKAA
jgi:hypothetical protein